MRLTNAGFSADTVSPLDPDAQALVDGGCDVSVRLPDLVRGATRSRRLADQHKLAAREHLRAAQAARSFGDVHRHRNFLGEATDARRRAAACCLYAWRCEQEANALAHDSGFLR